MGIKSTDCHHVHELASEARELGLTHLPSIPDQFEEPNDVVIWCTTVRVRRRLFLAGVTDASGAKIDQ